MKILAWTTIGLGVAAQLFYDLSAFLLPSMASAEGVAVYPSALESLRGLFYGGLPYAVFGAGLVMIERHFFKWSVPAQLGIVAGVLSPLGFMALAGVAGFPASQFREGFWPIRPVVQIAVFVVVMLLSRLINSRVASHSVA